MLFILQIGNWYTGSLFFLFWAKELQNQFRDNVATKTQQLNDLKSSMYTRNEAVIQFEAIRQENMRQDQEIRELRDKVIHERNR